jgi:hypothetical protein
MSLGNVTPPVNICIRYFSFYRTDNGVSITWFVSTRSDVADFRLVAREAQHVVLELDLPYSARSHVVRGLPASPRLELCLLARDSAGNVRHWRASQCTALPPGDHFSHSSAPYASVMFSVILVALLQLIAR